MPAVDAELSVKHAPVVAITPAVVQKRMMVIVTGLHRTEPVHVDHARKIRHTLRRPALVSRRVPGVARKVAGFLRAQRPIVAEHVARQYARIQKSASDHVTISLDWAPLAGLISADLKSIYKNGAARSYADLGGDGPFDQLNGRALTYAEERAAELVGMKWVDGHLIENPSAEWAITGTTRDNIRALINRALEEGLSPAELADAIQEMGDFADWRAEMIARTELAMAQEAGSLDGWRESGVVGGKEWILSSGHGSPDECDENADEGVIGLDENFSSGDDAPPAHPYCECDVVAVLDEEG